MKMTKRELSERDKEIMVSIRKLQRSIRKFGDFDKSKALKIAFLRSRLCKE